MAPPTFVFFARHADQVHFSYRRFLENQIRAEFGFDGTPLKLVFRERASGRSSQGEGRRTGTSSPSRVRGTSGRATSRPATGSDRKGTSGPKRSPGGKRNPQR